MGRLHINGWAPGSRLVGGTRRSRHRFISDECESVCMGDTSIRLSREAKQRLELHKREGESYDDVIRRLTSRNKWAGFGIAEDVDREGMRRLREQMNADMSDRIAEYGRERSTNERPAVETAEGSQPDDELEADEES